MEDVGLGFGHTQESIHGIGIGMELEFSIRVESGREARRRRGE